MYTHIQAHNVSVITPLGLVIRGRKCRNGGVNDCCSSSAHTKHEVTRAAGVADVLGVQVKEGYGTRAGGMVIVVLTC